MLAARQHNDAVCLQASRGRIVCDRAGKDDEAANEREQHNCHGCAEIPASTCHDSSPTVVPGVGMAVDR